MKFTNKGKQLAKVAAVVTVAYAALTGVSFLISHPTPKHIDVARQMSAGPEEADFTRLMASAESTWTINSEMALGVAMFILYVVAIYAVFRYLKQHRLTPNAGGITTAMFAFASTVALLVSTGINAALGLDSVLYSSGWALLWFSVMNLLVTFVITFIIVLLVERIYDRKHGFVIE